GTAAIRNSILWGNTPAAFSNQGGAAPTISASLIEGGCPAGATCSGTILTTDPQFVTPVPSPAPSTGGDLHLQVTTQATDADDNNATAPMPPAPYRDSNLRRVDVPTVTDTGVGTAPIVDMGAYEAIPAASPIIYVKANATGANNGTSWTDAYTS